MQKDILWRVGFTNYVSKHDAKWKKSATRKAAAARGKKGRNFNDEEKR